MARGAAWMVLFRLFDRSVGVVSTLILARLLVPADFGLVAMGLSVIAIIELATAFSFEVALIQKERPEREHYDTAWTLNILVSFGGALVTAALALPTAQFYDEPRLVPVMLCIAAGWLLAGFENIGTVNFRREMDFSSEFRLMATKRVATFAVTIGTALILQSYWALVVGTVAGRVTGLVLSYAMHPFRPRLSLQHARELFSFSGWLLAANFTGVVLSRLPHFVVGRVFGAQALGTYTLGSEIAQLAHTEVVAPINRAMFPGYARLAKDRDAFRRVCVDATAVILIVVLPISVTIASLAGPIVRLLLGTQWAEAVPVIRILAFSGAVSALTSNNTAAYIALGRPQLNTLILSSRLVLFGGFALLLVSGRPEVSMVAYAELIAALGSLLVSLPVLFRALELRAVDYLAVLWRPLGASAMMAALLFWLTSLLPAQDTLSGAGLGVIVGVLAGGASYVFLFAALWALAGRPHGVEVEIARRARGVLLNVLRRRRQP